MVTDDPAVAASLLGAGQDVVLLVDPDAGQVVRSPNGPGRLAVFVGPGDDPEVRAAAAAMAAELFYPGRPVKSRPV